MNSLPLLQINNRNNVWLCERRFEGTFYAEAKRCTINRKPKKIIEQPVYTSAQNVLLNFQ